MLVIMAVVTTLMASPIFDLLVGRGTEPIADPEACERRTTVPVV